MDSISVSLSLTMARTFPGDAAPCRAEGGGAGTAAVISVLLALDAFGLKFGYNGKIPMLLISSGDTLTSDNSKLSVGPLNWSLRTTFKI